MNDFFFFLLAGVVMAAPFDDAGRRCRRSKKKGEEKNKTKQTKRTAPNGYHTDPKKERGPPHTHTHTHTQGQKSSFSKFYPLPLKKKGRPWRNERVLCDRVASLRSGFFFFSVLVAAAAASTWFWPLRSFVRSFFFLFSRIKSGFAQCAARR